jgi:hypothetical protein
MELKPLKHGKRGNRFCGPAVISFITGLATEESAALIRQQTGRRMVTGTHDGEVLRALRACGYTLRLLGMPRDAEGNRLVKPTLAAWLKAMKAERVPGKVFLVSAGHHWQLITGRRYACGRIGEIVSVRDERVKRRARVREVYEVVPLVDRRAGTARALSPERVTQVRQKLEESAASRRADSAARTKAKKEAVARLEAQGWAVDVDDFGGGEIMISLEAPDWVEQAEEDGHWEREGFISHGWQECLDHVVPRVEEVMEELRAKGLAPKVEPAVPAYKRVTTRRRSGTRAEAAAKLRAEAALVPLGFGFEREQVDVDAWHIYVNRPRWFEEGAKALDLWIDETIARDWQECADEVVPRFEKWIAELKRSGYGPKERA